MAVGCFQNDQKIEITARRLSCYDLIILSIIGSNTPERRRDITFQQNNEENSTATGYHRFRLEKGGYAACLVSAGKKELRNLSNIDKNVMQASSSHSVDLKLLPWNQDLRMVWWSPGDMEQENQRIKEDE
ncbi:hypothetical protein B9Z55_026498 [Caenorhabditis nigoni]|uniref:Uncharacterized protein n=1 Tax=Caenorhabditis nigoni TaxID=1611254 RepID=A0A2G5T326_9PELO|nr:hypothetical protein B9Z55_026498 [Caenorhabditis nigoni]